jgi:type I restriction enzyme, S subunit
MISGGDIMAGINVGMLKSIKVKLPPMALQLTFTGLAELLERLRSVQQEALRQAEHLFASLLHRAFRVDCAQS